MFGIFTGVIVNVATVIVGTLLGCLFKGELLERIGQRVREAFGFFTMVLGVGGALGIDQPIFVLVRGYSTSVMPLWPTVTLLSPVPVDPLPRLFAKAAQYSTTMIRISRLMVHLTMKLVYQLVI